MSWTCVPRTRFFSTHTYLISFYMVQLGSAHIGSFYSSSVFRFFNLLLSFAFLCFFCYFAGDQQLISCFVSDAVSPRQYSLSNLRAHFLRYYSTSQRCFPVVFYALSRISLFVSVPRKPEGKKKNLSRPVARPVVDLEFDLD